MRIYLRKIKVCWQNKRFLTDLMPVLLEIVNRNNIYTDIYFKMQ